MENFEVTHVVHRRLLYTVNVQAEDTFGAVRQARKELRKVGYCLYRDGSIDRDNEEFLVTGEDDEVREVCIPKCKHENGIMIDKDAPSVGYCPDCGAEFSVEPK